MHIIFSSAFSSNFRKAVWQHTEGIVGSSTWIFFGNLPLFPAEKKILKSIKNWQSYRHEYGVLLFLKHSEHNSLSHTVKHMLLDTELQVCFLLVPSGMLNSAPSLTHLK